MQNLFQGCSIQLCSNFSIIAFSCSLVGTGGMFSSYPILIIIIGMREGQQQIKEVFNRMQRVSYRSKISESTEEFKLNHSADLNPPKHPLDISKPVPPLKKQYDPQELFDITKFDQSLLITLNKMRVSDQAFQDLLIQDELLDLQHIQQAQRHKQQTLKMKTLINPNTKIQHQIKQAKASLQAKANHLKQYHAHLSQKLYSKNTLIFVQEQNLLKKYQAEAKSIQKSLSEELESIERDLREVRMQRNINEKKMKLLFYQVQAKQQSAVSINKFGPVQVTQFKMRKYMRTKDEYNKLSEQRDSQESTQREYRQLNQSLKYLLTVEDQHNNSCMIIESCMVKRETLKVHEFVNRMIQQRDYQTKILPDLSLRIKEMRRESEAMAKKIKSKQKTLEGLTYKLTQVLQEFSRLNE